MASKTRDEAIARLREMVQPGDTLHTILRHRSASGMSRAIDVVLLRVENGKIEKRWLSRLAAKAVGWRFSERYEAVIVRGCGMDTGFHLVSTLSRVLFPEGFKCTGKGCPSNDHSNGDRNYKPHAHASGDYALHHAWL